MTLQDFWVRIGMSTELPFNIEDVDYVDLQGFIKLKNDEHPWRVNIEMLPLPEDFQRELPSAYETLTGDFKPDAE